MLNEHRKSVQACDLKSAVSEHARDTDHSIHWASVKIIGRENHFRSRKIREVINIHVWRPAMNRGKSYNVPQFTEQFCSLIKTRLLLLTTSIHTEEGV